MDKYRNEVAAFLKSVIQEDREFFVYDTETTGLEVAEADIIEFSALKCGYNREKNKFAVKEVLDLYINVGYTIPDAIQELTGITDIELAEKGVEPKEAAETIRGFFGKAPIIVGYNSISFDTAFVEKLYKEQLSEDFCSTSQLDVLTMAREKMPKPHKLADMAQAAGMKDLQFHRSIDDCRATLGVLVYLLPLYREKEPEIDLMNFQVQEINRWTKSAKLDRIYVKNSLNLDVYYDVFTKSWCIGANCDEEILKAKVFLFAGAGNERVFLEKYKN